MGFGGEVKGGDVSKVDVGECEAGGGVEFLVLGSLESFVAVVCASVVVRVCSSSSVYFKLFNSQVKPSVQPSSQLSSLKASLYPQCQALKSISISPRSELL